MPYILVSIFLWSSLGIVIKLSGMPVTLLVFFSCLISSSIMGMFFIKTDYRKKIPKDRTILYLILLSVVSLINTFTFFLAYKNTSVANAVLTHYTAPVIVAFAAPIFLNEKLTKKVIFAVAIASSGLWIMLNMSATQFLNLLIAGDKNTVGTLSGLISGFAYAAVIIVIRFLAQNVHPIVMTFFQNSIIAAILFPFIEVPHDIVTGLWAFGIMGIIHSTIAPILYFRGMREVTANKSAILGYLEPVCAIILGIIFLHEAVTYKTIIGGAMIIFSGYLTIRS